MKMTSLACLLLFTFTCGVFAQCPDSTIQVPQLHGVVVRATIAKDTVTKIFAYRFSVQDDNTSIGCITQFQVDITNPPGRETLQSSGLVDYPRYVVRNLGTPTSIALIPIGVPSLPAYNSIPSAWLAIVSRRGFISWGSKFNEVEVPPGGQLTNLVMTSYGLPSIRSYAVKPKYNPPPVEEGEVTEEAFETLRLITNSIIKTGFTVGPTAQPAPFDSLKFLDTLKSYTTQARTLGWITNQDTANRYSTLYDSVRAQFQRGSGQKARITLDVIIANTIRDTLSGAITSEAYALLRFNSEYLKAHLPSVTVSSAISTGWNMVSLPVEASDARNTTLHPLALSSAYAYSNAYVIHDTLRSGVGYWVKFGSSPAPINYKGLRVDSVRVPVAAGWNMVGSISASIETSKVRFDTASAASGFFGYSSAGYTATSTITPGKGYWIKVNQAGSMVLGATRAVIPPLTQEQPPKLSGTPDPPVLLSPDNGSTGQSLSPTLSWEDTSNATSFHLQVSTSSTFSSLIYDGAGLSVTSKQITGLAYSTTYYWKVNGSNSNGTGNWTGIRWFGTQSAPDPPPCTCCIESATSLDQFTVTDASGNSQSLLVNNAGKQLKLGRNDMEMPPAPFPGAFHARFHSNKFLENIPVGTSQTPIPLDLQNTTGSVTISWDIKPGNKITYWLTNPKTGKVRKVISGTGSLTFSSTGNGGMLIQAQASQPCP